MHRSTERILTSHVGSLIRPAHLRKLYAEAAAGGEQPKRAYADALRTAVADVGRRQSEGGVDIVSDGEFGKSSWAAYVLERITGFEQPPGRLTPVTWLGS